MDPPSTPPPVAIRGRHLDRALREVDSTRRAAPELDMDMPASIRAAADPEAAMAEAERLAREALEAPLSDLPPMTLRGEALERVLDGVRSSPIASGARTTQH